MTPKKGFILLPRSLQSSPFYAAKPYCKMMALVDLIFSANYQKSHYHHNGVLIEVKAGQLSIGQETLAGKWGWSRGKVIRFLNELETVQEIVQDKTGVTTLITMLNYSHYKMGSTTNGTGGSTKDGTMGGTLTNKYNKVNKGGGLSAPPLRRINP